MTKLLLAAPLALMPAFAHALPAVGDMVGTTPAEATAALANAGCAVDEFEAEGGQIEAKCRDDAAKRYEVYIDPKSGIVTKIKSED
ncbi:hypothetical protein ROJ8625_00252 [Roseivivax jejudonensis]|uniref:PepSY domain-containing protein n=1 Tax=Roseivivax jejudonensis TaxID=1529041 RepID=A0A1X6Y5J3_9RHOB|nr:PepSY domain-containing protein [Roseivivax jejudonensis]SLN11346.1 hypothetical protein ROJ8625_00252 [Roseivivax jejudonensis]